MKTCTQQTEHVKERIEPSEALFQCLHCESFLTQTNQVVHREDGRITRRLQCEDCDIRLEEVYELQYTDKLK